MGMGDIVRNILVNIRLNATGFRNGIKVVNEGLIRTNKQLNNFSAGSFKLGASLQMLTQKFQGWLLSLLFFGMAIERLFTRILRAGVNSFTKIMDSSEMMGYAIQRLTVYWEYLSFVIGSAINRFLEPLMPLITRIIDSVSEWIQKHQNLTAILVIGGIVIGTLLMLFGLLGLAILGLIQGATTLGPIFTSIWATLAGVSIATIGIIIAIIILLVALWVTNFGKIRDFVINTFGVIYETIKSVMGNVWNVIKDLMKLIVAIFKGDWEEAAKIALDILKNLAAIILKILAGIAAVIMNVVMFVIEFVKDVLVNILLGLIFFVAKRIIMVWGLMADYMVKVFESSINYLIKRLNSFIRWLNKFGFNISPIDGEAIFSGITDAIDNMVLSGIEGMDKIMAAAQQFSFVDWFGGFVTANEIAGWLGGIDDLLGTGKTAAAPSAPSFNIDTVNITSSATTFDQLAADMKRKIPSGTGVG